MRPAREGRENVEHEADPGAASEPASMRPAREGRENARSAGLAPRPRHPRFNEARP